MYSYKPLLNRTRDARVTQAMNAAAEGGGDSLNQRIVLETVGETLLLVPAVVKATMQK
jgi:hypothetical protein